MWWKRLGEILTGQNYYELARTVSYVISMCRNPDRKQNIDVEGYIELIFFLMKKIYIVVVNFNNHQIYLQNYARIYL